MFFMFSHVFICILHLLIHVNYVNCAVSLENITTDVHELEKGMDLVRKEFELRGKEKHNTVLRDFLNNSEEKLRRLKLDARTAGEAFRECVEFFGESPRQADANTFFSLLVRFARAFKVRYYILYEISSLLHIPHNTVTLLCAYSTKKKESTAQLKRAELMYYSFCRLRIKKMNSVVDWKLLLRKL